MQEIIKNENQEQTTEQAAGMFSMVVGKTSYVIGLHYKQDGKETLEETAKKLIREDMKAGNF